MTSESILTGNMTNIKEIPQRFIQNSYNRSDVWAISLIKAHLEKNGYLIHNKTVEDFEIDIKAEKDGKIEFFEVETKTGYPFSDQNDFKFDTVSFLARKKKWASVGFWYIILCRETLAFLMCNSKEIFKDEYREFLFIDSAERKGKDEFYRVPKHKCYWYKLAV